MKTLLKVAGLVALGAAALVGVALVFHLALSLLHLIVPLAVLAGIGYLAWRIFGGSPAAESQAPPTAQAALTPEKPARQPLSDQEALRQFEELKKKQPS